MGWLSKAAILGLLVGILGMVCSFNKFGYNLEEDMGLGLLFKIRGSRNVPPEVVIVSIDNASADSFDLPPKLKTWPRSLHASLIENLTQRNVSLIVFDIVFDEERSMEQDVPLARATAKAGNVLLCDYLKSDNLQLSGQEGEAAGAMSVERLITPIPLLADAALASAPFPLPKVPVRVDQYWTFKTTRDDKPTLPVVAFQIYSLPIYDDFIRLLDSLDPAYSSGLPHNKEEITTTKDFEGLIKKIRKLFETNPSIPRKMHEKLEKWPVSSDSSHKKLIDSLLSLYQSPGDSLFLNYYGPAGTITTVPFYKVVKEPANPGKNLIDFNRKVVFVGLSELLRPQQSDGFHTVFSRSDGIDISGVEIAATAFANLIDGMPVRPISFEMHIIIIFLWAMLLAFVCRFLSTILAALALVALSAAYVYAAQHQFSHEGIWYPLIIPLAIQAPAVFVGSLLWKYLETKQERQNVIKAFGYYLPKTEVERLAKDLANIRTSERVVHGICLLTDLARYSSLSETIGPDELRNLMNRYYEVIFKPVKQHGGIVTDVVGDSMLAIWTQVSQSSQSGLACQAALDIVKAINLFSQTIGGLQFQTRIGLHSGKMSLGNIGAGDHYEYTPVGDVVNTASRIENLNKFIHTNVLISDTIVSQENKFLTREIGQFLLAGKSKPTSIYELICPSEQSSIQQKALCKCFARALYEYRNRRWGEAISIFQETLSLVQDDGPSLFYLDICQQYMSCPPAENWTGMICVEKK